VRNVLVTGGAGFLGSHLVDALLAAGDRVVALDDLSTGGREHVAADAELVEADVADANAVSRVFAAGGFDLVFHVAGQASIAESFSRPVRDLRTNVEGTVNVLEACVRAGVPRLVYASSMTVYGEPESVPTPETEPCRPVSYYGITKYAAERYVHVAGDRTDIDLSVTSLRMFNVYGERQSLTNPYQGVLAIFIGNVLRRDPITIHSDGRQTRDFVYVGDVVDAWLRVVANESARGAVYNVGSGIETSIAELADSVLVALDRSPGEYEVRTGPTQPGDQRRAAANVTALRDATAWVPKIPLEAGLRRTVTWAAASA
jgi:UDP-glucose 4-epimerase